MNELRTILKQNAVDTSSLEQLFESDKGHVYSLSSSGEQAVSLWQKLREVVSQTKHWPILIGDDDAIKLFVENVENIEDEASSTIELVEKGLSLDAIKWLQKRDEERKADWEEDADENEDLSRESGEWPEDVQASNQFAVPLDITTGKPLKNVFLALVPTQNFWEVPAIVSFGGWNWCPHPEEHVCMMKHWYEAYGAELVSLSGDTLEMKVLRPPSNREFALELAREQFIYCDDIVTQGTQTIENLAASLLNGTVWFFWWD